MTGGVPVHLHLWFGMEHQPATQTVWAVRRAAQQGTSPALPGVGQQ